MFYRLLAISLFLTFGCSSSDKKKSVSQIDSIPENISTNITHSIGEVLSQESRKLIENWQEYNDVEEVINEYYSISPLRAIENAKELSDSTQQLKDSIRVERFNQPDLKIRLNILNNTALRLNDMNQIPQISDEEITAEVSNLVRTFSSINSKLNSIVRQEYIEKELKIYNQKLNDY